MANSASVQVTGLRVVRGGRDVIPDLDTAIPSGQITGLLGPSGCGKTTLMRAIVGVQVLAAGSVSVLGEPAGSPALRRRGAYQPRAESVYNDLSVRENLDFFAAVLDVADQAVGAAIETVGLS